MYIFIFFITAYFIYDMELIQDENITGKEVVEWLEEEKERGEACLDTL